MNYGQKGGLNLIRRRCCIIKSRSAVLWRRIRGFKSTVDTRVKEEATAIYAAAGLMLSEAFRIMLMRTVAERALPFDPLIPNAETVKAMKAARRGDVVKGWHRERPAG